MIKTIYVIDIKNTIEHHLCILTVKKKQPSNSITKQQPMEMIFCHTVNLTVMRNDILSHCKFDSHESLVMITILLHPAI